MPCFFADLFGLLTTDSLTRAMFSGVRTDRGLPGGDLFTTLPLTDPSSDCNIWRRITSIQLTSKSSLRLYYGARSNEPLNSTNALLYCPTLHGWLILFEREMWMAELISKVNFTGLPHISNNSPAKSENIMYSNIFIISAGPCTWKGSIHWCSYEFGWSLAGLQARR